MTIKTTKQHLIDPELCLRCGKCQEKCPSSAISTDGITMAVNPTLCDWCLACMSNCCETGAIHAWRSVPTGAEYSVAEQLQWQQLPDQDEAGNRAVPEADK